MFFTGSCLCIARCYILRMCQCCMSVLNERWYEGMDTKVDENVYRMDNIFEKGLLNWLLFMYSSLLHLDNVPMPYESFEWTLMICMNGHKRIQHILIEVTTFLQNILLDPVCKLFVATSWEWTNVIWVRVLNEIWYKGIRRKRRQKSL